jgi:hypothetical protein
MMVVLSKNLVVIDNGFKDSGQVLDKVDWVVFNYTG